MFLKNNNYIACKQWMEHHLEMKLYQLEYK